MKHFLLVILLTCSSVLSFAQSRRINPVSNPVSDHAPPPAASRKFESIDHRHVLLLDKAKKNFTLSRQVFYLEDPAGQLTFSNVLYASAASQFKLHQKDEINFGYTKSHYWLKFYIKNNNPAVDNWLIEISYPMLDYVEFYYRNEKGLWQQKKMGDTFPFAQREIPYRYFIIPLHHPDTLPRTYYMKVATQGIVRLPIEITSTQDFYRDNLKAEVGYGLFYGIMIVMMLYNLLLFFSLKDTSYLYYVVAILGSSLLIASLSGHAYQHLLPDHPAGAANMVTCSMAIWLMAASAFARNFLYTKKYAPFMTYIHNGFIGLGAAIGILSFIVDYNVISRIATSSSTINCFVLMTSGVICWLRGNKSARYFVIAWTVYVTGLLMLAFKSFGVISTNAWTAHAAEVGAVAEVILLALALSEKYTLMRLEKKRAQEEALRIQREANEVLERKVTERTAEINQQKEEIEAQRDNMEVQKRELEKSYLIIQETNRHITDSIRYAKTIQQAILPHKPEMDKALKEYFVIYRPKDIVSGDFYWFSRQENKAFIAAVDCTGHGVPGAFMSMIGNTILNEIVNQKHIYSPAQVLEELNTEIRMALKQREQSNDDGMDVCFCSLEKLDDGHTRVVFAGAKRPLYFADHQGHLQSVKGSRRAIGGKLRREAETPFTDHELILQSGAMVYLMSDGLADQNDPFNNRFGISELVSLLSANNKRSMPEQKFILENALDLHQREAAQRDDITLIGIRI